ncbi:hypothetical protein [Cerasicoccus fimbriatus]|uniref:hypothetical protein n=1 Tax=Cerasicoccus fimbriatus TaxID=3014554 RepID=UPI0022B38390|nr:hypothetical protein [Cerasicoccus sp. TK19100]
MKYALFFSAAITLSLHADVQLTTWITDNSTKYARVYETIAARDAIAIRPSPIQSATLVNITDRTSTTATAWTIN